MKHLFIVLLGCSLLGCDLIQPKVSVKIPAYTNYEAILAWTIAEGMESDLQPIPAPPSPDNTTLKDGDDCPKCEGGYRPGDGNTRPVCISCNGDGICNTGDPILLPQEISVVVDKFTHDSQDFIKDQLSDMQDSIDELAKRMEAFKSCECDREIEETIIPQPETKKVDWYYIYKDEEYYFWYEDRKSFVSKGGSVVNISVADITSTPYVTICYGSHCLRHDIYKLEQQVEVKSGGPKLDNQLQDGTSRK